MPDAKVFVDSNTLLYTLDEDEIGKSHIAQRWLKELAKASAGVTNLQVLNETTNVLIRKANRFGHVEIFPQIDAFSSFGSATLTQHASFHARDIHYRTRYSWWDCLLLASALDVGCTHFLSEDLHDGQSIDGLTIIDPFAHTPEQILSI